MISTQEAQLRIQSMMGDDYQTFKELGAMLCGGALTSIFSNRDIKDYDFYFKSKESLEKAVGFLFSEGKTEALTANALTSDVCGRKYQLVRKEDFILPTPKDVISKFDFSICQAGLDLETGQFAFGPRFFSDLHKRRLHFVPECPYPISSFFRVAKYQRRGFEMPDSEMIKLLLRVREVKIESNQDLHAQLEAVYETRGGKVKELLKDKLGLGAQYDYMKLCAGLEHQESLDDRPRNNH